MAIVTYVDNRRRERSWSLDARIAVLKSIDEYLALTVRGDVLLLHGGQPEGPQDARPGRTLLIEALVTACQGTGRAVLFSGGEPLLVRSIIHQEMQNAGLTEGLHYLLLSAIENLDHELDLPRLLDTPILGEWRIDSARRQMAAPMLLTLALLSQAALLVSDPGRLDDRTRALLGPAALAVPPDGVTLRSPLAWQDVLGASAGADLHARVIREWPPLGGKTDAVDALITAIYDKSSTLDVPLIARAFHDLDAALAAKQDWRP